MVAVDIGNVPIVAKCEGTSCRSDVRHLSQRIDAVVVRSKFACPRATGRYLCHYYNDVNHSSSFVSNSSCVKVVRKSRRSMRGVVG